MCRKTAAECAVDARMVPEKQTHGAATGQNGTQVRRNDPIASRTGRRRERLDTRLVSAECIGIGRRLGESLRRVRRHLVIDSNRS
jgi:hypothetical protein